MFNNVKRLYDITKNKMVVYNAVVLKCWITIEEYELIVGEPFPKAN